MNNRLFLLVVILTLALGSCTSDRLEPCAPTAASTQITYSYTLNEQHQNLYDSKVNRVSIYIFDSFGQFIHEQSINSKALIQNDLPITLNLAVGKYTVVSWGGNSHLYQWQLTGSRLENFTLSAKLDQDQIASVDEFFGAGTTEIIVQGGKVNHYTAQFVRNIHTLKISVAGISNLPTKAAPSPIEISVSGNNTHFKADNSLLANASMSNYSMGDYSVDNDRVSVSLPILRIDQNTKVHVKITHPSSGLRVAEFDLATALRATPIFGSQADFDRQEQYDIQIEIDDQIKVTMKVNGWSVVDVGVIS